MYYESKKAKKLRSKQAHAAKLRKKLESADPIPLYDIDPYMEITIKRKATDETAVFECFEGTRIDNYRVYCNGIFQGIQSITTLTKNIRKALPRFRRMEG